MTRLRSIVGLVAGGAFLVVLTGCTEPTAESQGNTIWAGISDFVAEFIRSIAAAFLL